MKKTKQKGLDRVALVASSLIVLAAILVMGGFTYRSKKAAKTDLAPTFVEAVNRPDICSHAYISETSTLPFKYPSDNLVKRTTFDPERGGIAYLTVVGNRNLNMQWDTPGYKNWVGYYFNFYNLDNLKENNPQPIKVNGQVMGLSSRDDKRWVIDGYPYGQVTVRYIPSEPYVSPVSCTKLPSSYKAYKDFWNECDLYKLVDQNTGKQVRHIQANAYVHDGYGNYSWGDPACVLYIDLPKVFSKEN